VSFEGESRKESPCWKKWGFAIGKKTVPVNEKRGRGVVGREKRRYVFLAWLVFLLLRQVSGGGKGTPGSAEKQGLLVSAEKGGSLKKRKLVDKNGEHGVSPN